jgi:ParB-like chromosome segregation protein Spo0J
LTATAQPDLSHIHEQLRHLAVPLDSLVEDPDNARTHPDENVEAIRRSLAEFGQDQPLVVQVPGNVVRKGNGRLRAARQLGWTWIAALRVSEGDLRAAARAVADNRSGDLARWDDRVLAQLLKRFQEAPAEEAAPAVGFKPEQIERILSRYAPPPLQAGTAPGAAPGPGEAAPGEDAEEEPEAPLTSQVRMVNLFLNTTTLPPFLEHVQSLQARWGTQNTTDTVLRAVREAAGGPAGEAADAHGQAGG